MRRSLLAAGVLGIALAVLPASAAGAHPLGNFTVNTAIALRVGTDQVAVDLVVDMAEIPTVQARRGIDTNGDGTVDGGEAATYAGGACPDAARRIELTVDGRRAPLRATGAEATFPIGNAGLPTLRLSCALVADTAELRGEREVGLTSTAFTDRVGWREITAVGDRTTLVASNVATSSASAMLTAYPDDLLSSPPDQRSAAVGARPGGPPAPTVAGAIPGARVAQPRGLDGATRSFTNLVARQQLTVGFGIVALGLAVGLGAVHAFAPGHGKTVMAAYLVGEQGSLRQAAVIGLTVTATHTVGVLVLGIALSASTSLAPESIYPWLGIGSGLLLAGVGAGLLLRATGRRPQLVPAGHGHSHRSLALAGHPNREAAGHAGPDDHDGHSHGGADHHDGHDGHDGHADHDGHDHHDGHGHSHGGPEHDHGQIHWRSLVPLGLAGGMVPSPSAIVVLLGAIALGRAWFGVALVVAYGLGMAVTLTGAGLALVKARGAIERRLAAPGAGTGRLASLAGRLPVLTATAIVAGGLLLAVRGVSAL